MFNCVDIVKMGRKLLISIYTFLLIGCTKFAQPNFFSNDGGSSAPIESNKNNLELENLVISNLTATSMDVSISYDGDDNNNSIVRLYICSIKLASGCDPESGDMVTLSKSGDTLTATVDLTTTQITPGDLLKYKLVSSDSDGLSGGEARGFSIVPNANGVRLVNQLNFLNFSRDASNSDQATASVTDTDGNIYIAGYSNGSFGEANGGSSDIILMKITSSGELDSKFGINGIIQLGQITVNKDRAIEADYADALTIDSEGNLYLAGRTRSDLGEEGVSYDMFVAKFNSKGELDNSFAVNGVAQLGDDTMGSLADGYEYVTDIKLTSNNHVVVSGYTDGSLGETNAGSNDGFIAKFTDTGVLDTSFAGGSGIVQFGSVTATGSATGEDIIEAIVLDESDNIYATGSTESAFDEANAGNEDIFVLKLTSAGVLDTSFSTNGVLHLGNTTLGASAVAQDDPKSIVIDSNGDLFIAGYTEGDLGETNAGARDIFVIKILSTGSLDTSFSTDGIVQFGDVTHSVASGNEYPNSLALDNAGNILIAGHTYSSLGETRAGFHDAFVVRLTPNGFFDTSFSTDGIVHLGNTTFPSADKDENVLTMSLHSDGSVYIAGDTLSNLDESFAGVLDIFVAKITSSGNLDVGFSSNGVLHFGADTLGLGASGDEEIRAIALDASGNIYLGGYTDGSLGEANSGENDVFVIKILASTGAIDTSFGNNGITQLGRTTLGGQAAQRDYLSDLKIDNSGNIYIAGFTFGSLGESRDGGSDAFVAKLTSTGALDLTYGGGDGVSQLGAATVGTAGDNEQVSSMHLYADGSVLITGFTESDLEETGNAKDIFIAKLDSNGDLDTSFSTNGLVHMGTVTIGAGATGDEEATAIGVDDSSNIYITGNVSGSFEETNAGSGDIVVIKLTSAGAFDTSYDTNGIVHLGGTTLPAGTQIEDAQAILVEASGALYVGGRTRSSLGGETYGGGYGDALVIKLTSAGALDTSFSGDGILQLGDNALGSAADGTDEIHAMSFDTSGNIVVGGFTTGDFEEANNSTDDVFLVSITNTGILNTSFDTNGIMHFGQTRLAPEKVISSDELHDLVMNSAGVIYATGNTEGSMDGFNAGTDDGFLITIGN